MMPGLIHIRPLPSTTSSHAPDGGRLRKSFAAEKLAEDTPLLPGRAARFFPMHASQLVKLQAAPRPKQVADPLAELVRARLCGDAAVPTERITGGREYDPSSVRLAAMVDEFMENEASFGDCGRARCNCRHGNCIGDGCCNCDNEDQTSSLGGKISLVLKGLVRSADDPERTLLAYVVELLGSITGETNCEYCSIEGLKPTHGCLRRIVMKQLRSAGYNAAICKSRWDHSCGIPAGDYEFIDILGNENSAQCERLIVDIDFRAQFDIARPTSEYTAVWQILPPIFVGKPERLQRILNVMSEAAKQSLTVKGLHLPPWRKSRYLKAKWLSPCRRTSSESCREGEDVAGRDIASIAVRGFRMEAMCTADWEMLYHETGFNFLTGDMIGERDAAAAAAAAIGKLHRKREVPESGLCNFTGNERDEISVIVATDWQPPAVAPRLPQKPGKVTGLSSLFMQAGLAKPHPADEEENLARAA